MIVASIDIGTNTALLLIAKVELNTGKITALQNEYRMPRIGQGTKKCGVISSERLKILYYVLEEYDQIIQKFNCEKVIVTGTNAFRMADNTSQITQEIKKMFNYDLDVISGEEEAEYAYLGAISGFAESSVSAVIDIGGSSTEVIVGEGNNIISKRSFQLGSVSATEQFFTNSPPLKSEIEKLKLVIQKSFSVIDSKEIPKQVIAIAGTATTLACMNLEMKIFDEDKVNNRTITYRDIRKIITELNHLSSTEILDKYGSIMIGREDIIFAGAYILYQFMETFRIENIKVSSRGIRYGAIVNYIRHTN
jgi:exopolyphosphatase/guanosine-5'-triphosphate,3'-diphosphate pyrophosphatase